MPKASYRCPACQNEVDRGAVVCSNPACRRELAFCSHCLDVTTYSVVKPSEARWSREGLRCDRCEGAVVRCLTWLAGGYCNGLARAGKRVPSPLCVRCLERAGSVGRSVAGWAVMTALGGLVKRRK